MKVDTVEISVDELEALRSDSSAHKCFLLAMFYGFGMFGFLEMEYKLSAGLAYLMACWSFALIFLVFFIGEAIKLNISKVVRQRKKFWWEIFKKSMVVLVLGVLGPALLPFLFPVVLIYSFFLWLTWIYDLIDKYELSQRS